MARIRTVKPEFWTDEKVVELSLGARLLFIGLWNFADDDGRMEYSTKRLKMQIFPGDDDVDINKLCAELRRLNLVYVYKIQNKEYLQVINFHKHQKIDKRRASKFPAPTRADSRRLAPTEGKGREGKGMEGNGKETTTTTPPLPPSSGGGLNTSEKPSDSNGLWNTQVVWDLWQEARHSRSFAKAVETRGKFETCRKISEVTTGYDDRRKRLMFAMKRQLERKEDANSLRTLFKNLDDLFTKYERAKREEQQRAAMEMAHPGPTDPEKIKNLPQDIRGWFDGTKFKELENADAKSKATKPGAAS